MSETTSQQIVSSSIGEAWLSVAKLILVDGRAGIYDGLSMREVVLATLRVTLPRSDDEPIARFAGPERLAWMHANFTDDRRVMELGDADSYATRLYDYARSGRDQLAWVVDHLRRDPASRNATITTLQPLTDTTYIPCVSLLDFFVHDARLELVVYAHSIDFGAKGFANLVELAFIQERVARELSTDVGPLTMIVKSAHVYDSEVDYVSRVLADSAVNRVSL